MLAKTTIEIYDDQGDSEKGSRLISIVFSDMDEFCSIRSRVRHKNNKKLIKIVGEVFNI